MIARSSTSASRWSQNPASSGRATRSSAVASAASIPRARIALRSTTRSASGGSSLPYWAASSASRRPNATTSSSRTSGALRDYRATFAVRRPIERAFQAALVRAFGSRSVPADDVESGREACTNVCTNTCKKAWQLELPAHARWPGGRVRADLCFLFSGDSTSQRGLNRARSSTELHKLSSCGGRTSVHDITRRAVTNEPGVVDSDCSTVLLAQMAHAPGV